MSEAVDTWVALLHRPADPSAAGGVLADPGSATTFRSWADGRGGLPVGGRALTDRPGEGMTILRLPGPDRIEEAARLAAEDDVGVTSGFFTVEVRPWRVVMHG